MFNRKESGFREGIDTLIGANTLFTGSIEAEGTVRVDGKIKGDIKVGGDVYVGDNAVITGNITAAGVYLAGTVEGNIACSNVLKILSTAKLYGDIRVNSFVADEGALFQGKCIMETPGAEERSTEKTTSKRNYKKSSVLDDVYEEKEKNKEIKSE